MKKTIIKILLLLVLTNNLYSETLTLNLVDFAKYASAANKINILINDELKESSYTFVINDKKSYTLSAFRKAIQLQKLQLVKTTEFYYVQKNEYIEKPKFRTIKLNFVQFEDIKSFVKVYEYQ